MARVRLMSRDGLMGLAAASRFLSVNLSTLKFWCDRSELFPDAVVQGRRRFRRETLEKFRERIEYVDGEGKIEGKG